ncbi:MAG: hypothetical protein WAK84_09355 [Candidatus Cybelea sp.]
MNHLQRLFYGQAFSAQGAASSQVQEKIFCGHVEGNASTDPREIYPSASEIPGRCVSGTK